MVQERVAGKTDAVKQCFVLCCALSVSCRCALLAGLLAALVACLAGLLLQSVLRMVQVSASSGLRDQSFMTFMLMLLLRGRCLGIFLLFPYGLWEVGV